MIRLRAEHSFNALRWLLSIRLETFVALAIIAYFSGWHYVNTYFDSFGVNRSSFSFDDYTIFLYSFFVLVELPNILVSFTSNALKGVGSLLAMFLISAIEILESVHASERILQRTAITGLGIGCRCYFSIEAGRSDAQQVIYEKQARSVSITFTEDVGKALTVQYDKDYACILVDEIRKAGRCGAHALIWRNSQETMIMQYDSASEQNQLIIQCATYRIADQFVALIESIRERNIDSSDCGRTSEVKKLYNRGSRMRGLYRTA